MKLSKSEEKFVSKLEQKNFTPEQIENKLRNRRKARKILYITIPTLGVVTYLLGTAIYHANAQNFLTWNPFGV